MTDESPEAAVARVFRADHGRTVAVLLRSLRDLDAAEDAAQEAFALAAATWPRDGVPPNPQAWILVAARRRALDRLRRDATAARHLDQVVPPMAVEPPGEIDDELRLLLLCAHPALSPESQVALTLRFVGGLTTAEIARAFGTSEATTAQRLSRAKAKLRDAGIGARLPEPERWRDRVDVALAVVYGIYNEGYVTTRGHGARDDLALEGIRLARHLRALAPDDPEVLGLLALVLLLQSRAAARWDGRGRLVTLPEQDRSLWDDDLVHEGQELVRRCLERGEPGPYQVQAAIQAVHADAATHAATDWHQILRLHDLLRTWVDTSASRTARAVALGRVHGPSAGLAALEDLPVDRYTLAARASFHGEQGDRQEAARLYAAAAEMAPNDAERARLVEEARTARGRPARGHGRLRVADRR